MPLEETATPGATPGAATETTAVVEQEEEGTEGHEAEGEQAGEGDGESGEPAGKKSELTHEQKEIYALKRRIGRLTNQKAILEAEAQLALKQAAEAKKPETPPELTEEEVERRATERAKTLSAQQQEARDLATWVDTTIEQGRKKFKDFDEATRVLHEELDGFVDERKQLRPIMVAIRAAEKPHEVIKYLADDPELLADIAALAPIRQIRRIAQFEVEMGKASTPKPSKAPKPITPAKGTAAASDEPDPKDAERWIKWRNRKVASGD